VCVNICTSVYICLYIFCIQYPIHFGIYTYIACPLGYYIFVYVFGIPFIRRALHCFTCGIYTLYTALYMYECFICIGALYSYMCLVYLLLGMPYTAIYLICVWYILFSIPSFGRACFTMSYNVIYILIYGIFVYMLVYFYYNTIGIEPTMSRTERLRFTLLWGVFQGSKGRMVGTPRCLLV
jgi:hypothetical protein